MVEVVPPGSQSSGEHRPTEDPEQALRLIKEAEKLRKRKQEEDEKALIAESRLRAQGTNQGDSGGN